MKLDPSYTPTTVSTDASGLLQMPRGPLAYARSAPIFAQALAQARQQQGSQDLVVPAGSVFTPVSTSLAPQDSLPAWSTNVKPGQTLSGIIKEQMAQRGAPVTNSQALQLAQVVAKDNQIANPDLIQPGMTLKLDSLNLSLSQGLARNQAIAAEQSVNQKTALTSTVTRSDLAPVASSAQVQLAMRSGGNDHVVLERTLDRAVSKGFIPAQDRQAVKEKILQLSQQHRFSPDDFARLTLMESDGMNPKATNKNCHGIIQFCSGPDRGAASVGLGANSQHILNYSVLQQLDLVDKYFDDTGLKNYGPVSLDDLYLTVLTPAARNETRPNVALNIPGPQASYLHVNKDTTAPITRNSILEGLYQNAMERLGGLGQQAQARTKKATTGLNAYVAHAMNVSIR